MRCTSLLVVGATVAGVLASAIPGSASSAPNPCHTFSKVSADTLMKVPKGKSYSEKTSTDPYGNPICELTYKSVRVSVDVSTSYIQGQAGPDSKTYQRPKLGKDGEVTVSDDGSTAEYGKDNYWLYDGDSQKLPNKGKALYEFALAQSRAFQG